MEFLAIRPFHGCWCTNRALIWASKSYLQSGFPVTADHSSESAQPDFDIDLLRLQHLAEPHEAIEVHVILGVSYGPICRVSATLLVHTSQIVFHYCKGEEDRRSDDSARRRPHVDRKSTRLNSSHSGESRMPSSA